MFWLITIAACLFLHLCLKLWERKVNAQLRESTRELALLYVELGYRYGEAGEPLEQAEKAAMQICANSFNKPSTKEVKE